MDNRNFSLPKSIVCHDAGAANHIFSWLCAKDLSDEQYHGNYKILLGGPAKALLKQFNFKNYKLCNNINELLDNADSLLSGTGWASELEYKAIKYASQKGIKSIAVIDHWVNYRDRFLRNNIEKLPNEIWVTDNYAKTIAEREFPELPVQLMPNLYLKRSLESINLFHHKNDNLTRILYVLEPIREAWGKNINDGEFKALNYFIETLTTHNLNNKLKIKLRPHPSDELGKYDHWLSKNKKDIPIQIDRNSSLEELIAWSDIVVGCQSYAMVLALSAKKNVYTSIPPWAPSCVLPHKNIKEMLDLEIL